MHTCVTPVRHDPGCAAIQSITWSAARPGTWASSPPVPAASTSPVNHRSAAIVQRSVSGSWTQRGRPRRISSIPNTLTGGNGAARASATWAMYAACAVRQDSR